MRNDALDDPVPARLEIGEHLVRIAGFEPAWHVAANGARQTTRDKFGRVVFEVRFRNSDGRTSRTWMGRGALTRPDGSNSVYGALRLAAGVGPDQPHADLIGAQLRIVVELDRKGKLVVGDMRAPL
jgi:hypothetical protein